MAVHSNNFIRVRLNFDYPPPAVVDCRMCWLLVDLNTCRVVADLESVIREKFEFGRGSILSLFVEDCYLPHTESVYVVRDNDSVRVKVDCLPQVNGLSSCPDASSESCRKRQRPVEEEGPGENGVSKKKKRKKKGEESVETAVSDTRQASGDERSETTQEKKKKKKKKRTKAEEKVPTVTTKPAASPPKKTVKIPQKPPVAKLKPQKVSSSDSSSEEDKAPKKPAAQKPAPKTPSSAPASSTAPPTTKPTKKKSRPPSPSSSETSSDEATVVKSPPKTTSMTPKGRTGANSESQQAPPVLKSANGSAQRRASSSDSDSEEEIKLVIRRPAQQPGLGAGGSPLPPWGRGRGQSGQGGCGEGTGRGRGSGRGDFRGGFRGDFRGGFRGGVRGRGDGGFGFNYDGAREPSCQTDQLTNMSVVLQNGAEGAPKRDYSLMPLLAAPPQVGQKIAFKLLELTENYTPEVSEYKEGKIVSFDLTTKQIELLVLNSSRAPVEPGKFDLVYQNADGSESVEYAVSRGSRVTERWDSLLEPRLII